MQHVWILGLFFGAFFIWRWYYWRTMPVKKKLEKQILREAKRVRKMAQDIEARERELAIVKRAVAQLIHRYRRE